MIQNDAQLASVVRDEHDEDVTNKRIEFVNCVPAVLETSGGGRRCWRYVCGDLETKAGWDPNTQSLGERISRVTESIVNRIGLC